MNLFGSIRSMDARSLAGPVVDVQILAGTKLVREGAVIGNFFVIRSGCAELRQDQRKIGNLIAGDCFGEIDPVASSPQPFGVIACSPVRLLTFSAFGISRLCEAIPGAREQILEALPARGAEIRSLRLLPAIATSFSQGRRIEHGDRPVVGRDPAKLTHQAQRA
jgi:CRP-like cAMP-binding protein